MPQDSKRDYRQRRDDVDYLTPNVIVYFHKGDYNTSGVAIIVDIILRG
jgi:hypothetical protein